MEKKRKHSIFWNSLLHRSVLLYLLLGTCVIFLTFLTDNNALEIVIAGIASVFIGIGVNNFTSFETHIKDQQLLKAKISHCLKVMEITHTRITVIHKELDQDNYLKMKDELSELEQIITISMGLIKEEENLSL